MVKKYKYSVVCVHQLKKKGSDKYITIGCQSNKGFSDYALALNDMQSEINYFKTKKYKVVLMKYGRKNDILDIHSDVYAYSPTHYSEGKVRFYLYIRKYAVL